MITVADCSPLIGLNLLGRLELLQVIFDDILIPPAVLREAQSFALPSWIRIASPPPPEIPDLPDELGPGEREAISLAIHLPARNILLDDGAARMAAKERGLAVIGVLGVLLKVLDSAGELWKTARSR